MNRPLEIAHVDHGEVTCLLSFHYCLFIRELRLLIPWKGDYGSQNFEPNAVTVQETVLGSLQRTR